jgi:hypothetical protein
VTFIADVKKAGLQPLQDHGPADVACRNVMYAVRVEGFDDQNRPLVAEGSAGDLNGAVLVKATGPERAMLSAWAYAMPVVGGSKDTTQVNASRTPTGGGKVPTLTPARGPNGAGLQPCLGLEDLTYARDGSGVYNLAGDRKLPPGVGGVLVAALEETKQIPLLLDGGPLIAVNQAGEASAGTPVYDLKGLDGSLDETRYARLQSFWRVKQLVPPTKAGFAGVDPAKLKETAENGSLCWQLTGGGPSHLHGGGLIYDDAAIDAASLATANSTPVDAARRLSEQIAALPPGSTVVRGPTGEVNLTDGAFTVRTPGNVYGLTNPFQQAGGFNNQTQVRLNDPVPPTQARDPAVNPLTAIALVSARRGGPLEVGGFGCEHQIGFTTDHETVNAAHLRTGTLYRSPKGKEGDLDITDDPYDHPGPQPFKTRAFIKHDAQADHDWILGKGKGKFRLQAETLLSVAPREIIERIFPPEPEPPVPDPGDDPLPPGSDTAASLDGWPFVNAPFGLGLQGKFHGGLDPRPSKNLQVQPSNPGSKVLAGKRTPTGLPLPAQGRVASDESRSPPGQAWLAGKLYAPGICFVAPEQKGNQRVATGVGTMARPEVAQLLITAPHTATGVATTTADPCKKNGRVATGSVVLTPPCYSHDDLYNARPSPTGQPLSFTLPPALSRLVMADPTRTGGVKNGYDLVVDQAEGSIKVAALDTSGVATGGLKWYADGTVFSVLADGVTEVPLTTAGLNLDDLGDVDAAAPTDGQVLTWSDGDAAWIASDPTATGTGGGGLVGYPSGVDQALSSFPAVLEAGTTWGAWA